MSNAGHTKSGFLSWVTVTKYQNLLTWTQAILRGENTQLLPNMVINCIKKGCKKKHRNIHLNDIFTLKIAKTSLQKHNFPGMNFPNSTFFPCMNTIKGIL